MAQIATPAEVRELALIYNVELRDTFPGTAYSNPYYHIDVDDQEFTFIQIRPSGELIGDWTGKQWDIRKAWIQNELHLHND